MEIVFLIEVIIVVSFFAAFLDCLGQGREIKKANKEIRREIEKTKKVNKETNQQGNK